MNNSTSHSETYIPSMMSFVGLQQSNTQKSLWVDWETPTNTTTTSSSHHHFFNTTTTNNTSPTLPNLTPPPPPLPIPFPLYTPDYHQISTTTSLPPLALIKREEDHNHHHQCCFGVLSGSSCQCGRIGLNLGRRTYFSAGDVAAIDRLFRRSRGVYAATHQTPRCQAEGCNADLSNAKPYHRRHKVCEFHSKSSVVIAAGLQQRFCQQCSRFHVLSEFDESKRSCRKRLADHNRRRRKPQPSPSDSSTSNNSNSMMLCDSSNNDTIEEGEQQKQNKATNYQNGSQFSSSLDSPSSSGTYFHHHNLFSSSEASHSGGTGGGSSDHHPEELQNLLQLGQAMFEVDLL